MLEATQTCEQVAGGSKRFPPNFPPISPLPERIIFFGTPRVDGGVNISDAATKLFLVLMYESMYMIWSSIGPAVFRQAVLFVGGGRRHLQHFQLSRAEVRSPQVSKGC